MAKVVHFELTADEPERAVEFYKKVFDWKIDKWNDDFPYWLCTTGEKDEPGIDGAIMKRDKNTANNIIVGVDNLEATMEKIKEAGGTVLTEIMPVTGVGYSVYFKDTEDNMIGLFKWDCDAK
jgi:uncharacterized protein